MKLLEAFFKFKMEDKVKRPDSESYEVRALLRSYNWSEKARKRMLNMDISDEELFADDWELVEMEKL